LRQLHPLLQLVKGIVKALGRNGYGTLKGQLLASRAATGLLLFDETTRLQEHKVQHALKGVEVWTPDNG
jgi:hypothetical protein